MADNGESPALRRRDLNRLAPHRPEVDLTD
jgi:hypothetical protein